MKSGALARRRIGLLTASASRLGGGVFEAVAAHVDLLRQLDAIPVVFALEDEFSADDAHRFSGAELHFAPVIGPGFFGYAPRLGKLLEQAALDLLHLHGIWMYPSQAGSAWAARSGKPYLISPHGMLDPWITGRGQWKKFLARTGYERRSWKRAAALHALTPAEARDIAGESGRRDSLVIPNAAPSAVSGQLQPRNPTVLYLGRIHPKKNIDALIAAWTTLSDAGSLPDKARLVIAGWGESGDVASLEQRLANGLGSIEFVGPRFGEEKSALLGEARFVALPSLSEGLPMAILEAWAAGTPTLMSTGCNLAEGFAAGAAIEVGTDPASIARSLRNALAMPDADWLRMARAARHLAEGPFSAGAIAARWEAAYAGLMEGKRCQ